MTRHPTHPARILAAVGAVLVVLGALTGCSARPGTAGILSYTGLDGTAHTVTVSETDVQDAATDLAALEGVDAQYVLNYLLFLPILQEAAAANGVTVTDQDAQVFLEQTLGETREYSPGALGVIRAILLGHALNVPEEDGLSASAADANAMMSTVEVQTSPRYRTEKPWLAPIGVPVT
ncbi:hypothetical protein [Actinomyces oricola]|uniref:hypothetical protein n=1 Tax=Actinomyces oricola TaxID=206043 RepID=UPI000FFE959D|nr:hypothetical protein [Actinomyces oricola]